MYKALQVTFKLTVLSKTSSCLSAVVSAASEVFFTVTAFLGAGSLLKQKVTRRKHFNIVP